MNKKTIQKIFLIFAIWLGIGLIFSNLSIFGAPAKQSTKTNSSEPVPSSGAAKQQSWDKKMGPLVPHKTFPKDCGLCHVPERWDVIKKDFKFNHEKETGYRLEGAHATAFCVRCHNDRGNVKTFSVRGCAGCHVDPHKGSNGPTCVKCHNQFDWKLNDPAFQHSSTRFPLTGVHNAVSCVNCHKRAEANDFQGAPTDCYSCHRTNYEQAPNHVALKYSKSCQECHQTSAWSSGAGFEHARLPSGGAGQCFSCHQANFQTAPNHVAQNFSHTCDSCHNTTSWVPNNGGAFNHATLANGGAGQCYNCHQAKYTSAPKHVANNYPKSCESCHTTLAWPPIGGKMNHSALPSSGVGSCFTCHQTNFQTAPNHVAQNFSHSCESCHTTSNWTPSGGGAFNHAALANGGAGQCFNCHQAKYTAAPNHVAHNYPKSCESCHTTSAWPPIGGTMNHSALPAAGVGSCYTCHVAKFQTAPNHVAQNFSHSCEACHTTSNWTPSGGGAFNHATLPSGGAGQCYNCHQAKYTSAPNHVANNYPKSCESCHTTLAWPPIGGKMNHAALPSGGVGSCYNCHLAKFQAAPKHVAQNFPHACEKCHNTNSFAGATFQHSALASNGNGQCYTCHQPNFAAAPNHVAQNYSHTCESCHSPNSTWNSASFNHSTLPSGGVGSCYNCHQQQFQSAPNHVSMSFPRSCQDCHTTTSFQGATFVHAFPLTGRHNVSCTICHASGTQSFNCLASCHAKTQTDNDHRGENGYSYSSPACYNCHPRGKS